jgi:sec-independent protein translocase protein TatA
MGIVEVLVVVLVVVFFFGARRLPQLGEGLGKAIRNFKGALKDGTAPRKDPPDSPAGGSA